MGETETAALPVPFRARNLLGRFLPLWCALLALVLVQPAALGRDLWTDEAFSASYARHPSFDQVLEDVRRNEETPIAYFTALWLWGRVFGTTEAALRSLSLLAGLCAAAVVAALARRRLPLPEAAVAAATLACSPLLIPYMVELRGYTMTLLLTAVCVAAFEALYQAPERRAAVLAYGLAAAALFLTSYFSVALLGAHQLIWLWSLRPAEGRRRRLLAWLAAQALFAAAVGAWLPHMFYQASDSAQVTASFVSGPSDYYWLALSLLMNAPGGTPLLPLWFALAVGLWGLILLALASDARRGGLIGRAFGVPAVLLLLLVVVMQVNAPRYLIVLLPGAALAVGAGFGELRRRRARLALVAAAALLAGMVAYRAPAVLTPNVYSQQIYPGTIKPWSTLAPIVAAEADPQGDAVLIHPPWDARTFQFYYQGPELPVLGALDYDDFYARQGYRMRYTWTTDEALAVTKGYRRVWVFYDTLFHQVPRLKLPYREVGRWASGRVELLLYEIPSEAITDGADR